jgi:lactoylglutathione lyase
MANDIRLSGFGINVDDLDRSVEFYTQVLGLQEKTKIDLGELHEVLVGGEDDRTAILLVKHADRTDVPTPGTGFEKIVLVANDIDALYQRVGRSGGTPVQEPWTLARLGMKVALVRDPDGYLIELIEQGAQS